MFLLLLRKELTLYVGLHQLHPLHHALFSILKLQSLNKFYKNIYGETCYYLPCHKCLKSFTVHLGIIKFMFPCLDPL